MSLHAHLTHRLSPAFSLDVDLEAPAGITILFGPSGSGKSTVLRCIAGLTRPDTGAVTLDGRAVFDSTRRIDLPPQRRQVGFVFQHLALFPHLSVAANIAYGLSRLPTGARADRIATIAESFRITPILDRRPAQISGGERQRVALARTLVTEPAALLLDEPLSALDHAIQSHIIDDLRRWNQARRIPVLYVTHAHREVYALGDRVIVLEGGRVTAAGPPHDVLDHPGRGTVAHLAGFENILAGHVVARRPAAGTMTVRLDGSTVELEVPLPVTATERVTIAIRAGDILVADHLPHGISARNVLDGRIDRLQREGPTVIAHVAAGIRLVAHLTPASVEDLGLAAGSRVWLIIKTYSCRIAAG